MIEDMSMRGFTEDTRRDYIRCVKAFAAFIGRSPDTATAEDLRRVQLHQPQAGIRPLGINSAVSAQCFFFTVTLDRPDLSHRLTVVHEPRKLPLVLSVEEVARLPIEGFLPHLPQVRSGFLSVSGESDNKVYRCHPTS